MVMTEGTEKMPGLRAAGAARPLQKKTSTSDVLK